MNKTTCNCKGELSVDKVLKNKGLNNKEGCNNNKNKYIKKYIISVFKIILPIILILSIMLFIIPFILYLMFSRKAKTGITLHLPLQKILKNVRN